MGPGGAIGGDLRNRVFWEAEETGFFGKTRFLAGELSFFPCYNNRVLIEEKKIQPTNDQAQACVRVCQMLSNCFRDIQVFRYNPQERYIFILAGDNLQILVFPNGIWRFINETEL